MYTLALGAKPLGIRVFRGQCDDKSLDAVVQPVSEAFVHTKPDKPRNHAGLRAVYRYDKCMFLCSMFRPCFTSPIQLCDIYFPLYLFLLLIIIMIWKDGTKEIVNSSIPPL